VIEKLKLDGPAWVASETFGDGHALFAAVCKLGYEGVVAKNNGSTYGPNVGGWVKVKNPSYRRRDVELEAIARKDS
jgi:ATP-dependent DNA ligase